MKKFKIVLLASLLLFLQCSGVQYKQTTDYMSDVEYTGEPNKGYYYNSSQKSALNYKQKKKWEKEVIRIQEKEDPNNYKYDMLLAHCYRKLDKHEESYKNFKSAAKKTRHEKVKKDLHKEAITSMYNAGLAAELRGDYLQAVRSYEVCNDYCKRFGFEVHVPHDKIMKLKEKAKQKK